MSLQRDYRKYEFFEDLLPLQNSVGLPFFKYYTFCMPDAWKSEVTTHLLDLQFTGVPAEFQKILSVGTNVIMTDTNTDIVII
jgi:hypothetical protein